MTDIAFRNDFAAQAALSALLLDAAEIIRRMRIDKEADYCRETLAEFAMIAWHAFDDYRGEGRDPLAYAALRRQVERELLGELEGVGQ